MISDKLGVYDAQVSGKNVQRLMNELIISNISISGMQLTSDKLLGRVLYSDLRKLKRLCKKHECELLLKNKRGIIVGVNKFGRHFGIYAGIILLIILLSFFSNHILQVKIVGADKETREAINAVLDDFDIGFGTFIPGINFYELETALTLETDCIAWAGIRSHGSTLVINISQTKQAPPMKQKRMPANIISTKDAVITDVQIYSGSLSIMLGDAVAKGQILVSGEYTDADGDFCYRYAQADIYGTYSETLNFTEDFISIEKNVKSGVFTSKSLNLFDAQIPLGKQIGEGNYIENSSTSYFSFLGLELPVGITHTVYDEYDYVELVRTEEEARKQLYADIERYEQNFLSDVDIIEKDVKVKRSENGLSATVCYVVNGEIGDTQIILGKKY